MNPNSKLSGRITIALALGMAAFLPSCAVDSENRPEYSVKVDYEEGVTTDLPADFLGSYYYYKGRYYYGGRHEIGWYHWRGRRYDHRYYHGGRYYYSGQYYRGRDYYRGVAYVDR